MENIYLVCAIAGGTLLAWQMLMSLVGLGGDHGFDTDHEVGFDHEVGHEVGHDTSHDAGHDPAHAAGHTHASALFVGLLTFRTVTAALLFFGLAGLAAHAHQPDEPAISLGIALAAGIGALLLVASMMKTLHRLKADGTARIDRAIGRPATVYLTVPARKQGAGKVTVKLQNRTMEYHAVTSQDELPTGASVVVVSVVGPGTLEVALAPSLERTTQA
jgi:membrane protein implicated in regulation of membrane protease activity